MQQNNLQSHPAPDPLEGLPAHVPLQSHSAQVPLQRHPVHSPLQSRPAPPLSGSHPTSHLNESILTNSLAEPPTDTPPSGITHKHCKSQRNSSNNNIYITLILVNSFMMQFLWRSMTIIYNSRDKGGK